MSDDAISVRPTLAADEERVLRFLTDLEAREAIMRFFSAGDVRVAAWRASQPTTVDRACMLVESERQEIVALGAFSRLYGPRAEVVIEVASGYRGNGTRALLLAELAKLAESRGISSLVSADGDAEL